MTASPTADRLRFEVRSKTVLDLINLFERGHLQLSPGFQRHSVWTLRDRQKLIDSILRHYPVPAVFLYRRNHSGTTMHDVIDGKQRLESIFQFVGLIRGRFALKDPRSAGSSETIDWTLLKRRNETNSIHDFELSVIYVDGSFAEIVDLFVRINSTGKALTRQEKAHARFFSSPFLKAANQLARKFTKYLVEEAGVLSAGQVSRMRHVELVSELMLSIQRGDVLNRKSALDKVISGETMDGRSIQRAIRLTTTALNRVRKMFPKLNSTRYRKIADFYTLVVLIARFESEGAILTEPERNASAWMVLVKFSQAVDGISEKRRRAQNVEAEQEDARQYLLTVSEGTDEVNHRRTRERILRQLLESLFAKKDSLRAFTPEQRRLLWNSSKKTSCVQCGAGLSWANFTIDHLDAHSRGGRTALENAAILCRSCNSAKGARRRPAREG